MLKIIGTALLTVVATSFFWIWFYGAVPRPAPQVERSGTFSPAPAGSMNPRDRDTLRSRDREAR